MSLVQKNSELAGNKAMPAVKGGTGIENESFSRAYF